jgi:PAS domain S-box-containing protein
MTDAASNDRVHQRLAVTRQLLGRLARSEALARGDVTSAYREVTELACELLGLERASVWLFDPLRTEIECVDLYERSSHRHSSGTVIRARDVPSYFRALTEQRVIAAGDAHTDPRTSEFSEAYLGPLGIGAMLDAPIWAGGSMVGVICHEHVGPARAWSFVEELLAGTVADFVARVFEASQRVRAEEALGVFRERLDALTALRSSEADRLKTEVAREVDSWRSEAVAQKNAEELMSVVEGSPVPLVVTGTEDGVVRWVNRRAAELFETTQSAMPDRSGPSYWLEPADRLTLFDSVAKHGQVDGFVARLTTFSGRPFWALLSARNVRYQGDRCVMIGLADITAQKVAELAVRESEERIRHVFDAAPVSLILSRAKDNLVLLANSVAARLFEVPLELVVGQSTPSYWVDTAERDRIVEELVREGHADTIVTRLRTATGREFWGMLSARRIQYEGDVCFLVGVADVTAQKEAEEALRDQATRDALTGVPNRRKLLEIAEIELSRARRTASRCSTSIISSASTTTTATPSEIRCWPRSLTEAGTSCALRTYWRGWAARSSRYCFRKRTRTARAPWPRDCGSTWRACW